MTLKFILLGRHFNTPGALCLAYAAEFMRVGDWGFAAAFVVLAALLSVSLGLWAERA